MTDLLRRLDRVHPRYMPAVAADVLGALPGVDDVRLLLLDQEGLVLLPFHGGTDGGIDVASSAAGSAVTAREPVLEPVSGSTVVVHIGLRVRVETVGVLSVTCTEEPSSGALVAASTLTRLGEAAHELAYAIVGSGAWSDHVPVARRARPMTLPAELQWSNLPLQALEGDRFSVAGKVLPTYEVGGDLFDISWGPRGPWVSVADAVGHGLRSSLLAHAAIGTTRHARRCGLDVVGQAEMADRTLVEQWGGLDYVTALLGELDLDDGVFRWVNAGHPPPLLLRGGSLELLARPTRRPLGLLGPNSYVVHELEVRPKDRLVLVSDGMSEARRMGDPRGPFGPDRLQGALLGAAAEPATEAVRDAVRVVDDWTSGKPRDDATIVLLDIV